MVTWLSLHGASKATVATDNHDDDGLQDCRFEIWHPGMGQRLASGIDIEVGLSMVDCDFHENHENHEHMTKAEVFLDGERIAWFKDSHASFTIPPMPKGYHILFVRNTCQYEAGEKCTHVSDINGTSLFTVYDETAPTEPRVYTPMSADAQMRMDTDSMFTLGSSSSPWWHHNPKVPKNTMDMALNALTASIIRQAQENPSEGLKWAALGRLQQSLGQFDQSISSFSRALDLQISNTQALDVCSSVLQSAIMARARENAESESVSGVSLLRRAYFSHMDALMPRQKTRHDNNHSLSVHRGRLAREIVYGIVTGKNFYATRASAVASTWLLSPHVQHVYIYGEQAGHVSACVNGTCTQRHVLTVTLPCNGPTQRFLARVTYRDDFFSSVPKFLFALVHMYNAHPDQPWYYVGGCDTYLVPENLAAGAF